MHKPSSTADVLVRSNRAALTAYFAALILTFLSFSLPSVVCAQSINGSLIGRVTDGSKAVIVGATVVATCLSLAVLAALARPLLSWRGAMILALAGVFAALFTLPWLRHQLALSVLPAEVLWPCVAIAAAGFGVLIAAWSVVDRVSWLRPAGNP